MSHTNTTQQLAALAPQSVVNAIEQASSSSGVDFSYLLTQAKVESSFDPLAEASTSSATGLYQFIDSTWLNMIERYGDQYGIDTDGKSRSEILALRKDPEKASFMAAAFASENERFLTENWGGDVGATELYLAHFMGAGGSTSFLKALDDNPLQTAADLFPQAANANRNVFYDRQSGETRTLAQVYDFFDQKFQVQPSVEPTKPKFNSLYVANTGISNHAFMIDSHAQRQSNQVEHNSFFNLLVKPLDVAMLLEDKSLP